jgi:hypothetical protein
MSCRGPDLSGLACGNIIHKARQSYLQRSLLCHKHRVERTKHDRAQTKNASAFMLKHGTNFRLSLFAGVFLDPFQGFQHLIAQTNVRYRKVNRYYGHYEQASNRYVFHGNLHIDIEFW